MKNRPIRTRINNASKSEKCPNINPLLEKEYKEGISSGKFMHVYDMRSKKIGIIARDGYYPPEQLNQFISLEP